MDATATQLMARLRQSPLDPHSLEAVRRYCDDRADFPTLAEALDLHVRALTEVEADPAEIGRLHVMLGNLWRDQLRRPERALAHYRAAIDFDAAQRGAMSAARAIFADAGRWDQVAKLLSREAESLPPGARIISAQTDSGRLILRVKTATGEEIDILDLADGRLVSQIRTVQP